MTAATSTAGLDQLLRRCVMCGLCLPHCATYLASGDETLSPRGRLLLLGEVLQGRLPAREPAVARAFDLCLGCMACTATCPSGVAFDLVSHLQTLGRLANRRPGPDPVTLLDRPWVLRLLRRAGAWSRCLLVRLLGADWRRRLQTAPPPVARLARWLGTLPTAPEKDHEVSRLLTGLGPAGCADAGAPPATRPDPMRHLASGGRPPRLAWFQGCADQHLLPGSNARLRGLLTGLGCRLVEPSGQVCCGALAAHGARSGRQRRWQDRNRRAFSEALADCDHLVAVAAGCSLHLQAYPGDLGARVEDVLVVLDRLLPPVLGSLPLRVAVHDPCHRRHGLGVVAEPRRLLARIGGLVILEPDEADVCCGSAGVQSLRHVDLAQRMGRRKAEVLVATGCDLVVTTEPGCLGQIADGLALVAPRIPVLPLTDLIWYAWSVTNAHDEKVTA